MEGQAQRNLSNPTYVEGAKAWMMGTYIIYCSYHAMGAFIFSLWFYQKEKIKMAKDLLEKQMERINIEHDKNNV